MINVNVIYIFILGTIRIYNVNPLVGICIGCEYAYSDLRRNWLPQRNQGLRAWVLYTMDVTVIITHKGGDVTVIITQREVM